MGPRHENETKMDAELVVRESQVAVFVNEGTIADVCNGCARRDHRCLPHLPGQKV